MDADAATVIASDSKRAPHEEQKRAPWPDAAPHLEQDTAGHCNQSVSVVFTGGPGGQENALLFGSFRAGAFRPHFAAIRTSVRIHGWMQH